MTPVETPPAGLDDGELARRWQAGDRAAGAALLDRHQPRLRAFLAARCGAEGDDLAQEVFLAVCRHLGRYDAQQVFTGWLYAIARHKLADHWRRRRPTEPLALAREEVDDRTPLAIAQETDGAQAAWRRVFSLLPEAQATALWLRVQEQLAVDEIARAMNVSLANAKVLLFRARQTLTPHFRPRP